MIDGFIIVVSAECIKNNINKNPRMSRQAGRQAFDLPKDDRQVPVVRITKQAYIAQNN